MLNLHLSYESLMGILLLFNYNKCFYINLSQEETVKNKKKQGQHNDRVTT